MTSRSRLQVRSSRCSRTRSSISAWPSTSLEPTRRNTARFPPKSAGSLSAGRSPLPPKAAGNFRLCGRKPPSPLPDEAIEFAEQRKGFGSVVLQRVTPQSLSGSAVLERSPGRLRWSLVAPVETTLVLPVLEHSQHARQGRCELPRRSDPAPTRACVNYGPFARCDGLFAPDEATTRRTLRCANHTSAASPATSSRSGRPWCRRDRRRCPHHSGRPVP